MKVQNEFPIFISVLVIVALLIGPSVFATTSTAYSGNNNIQLTDNGSCSGSEMSVTENVTSPITEFDGNGKGGTYGWQLEIFTTQDFPAYQQAVLISNYEIQQFFLENVLSLTNYYGQNVTPGISINPALTSTSISAYEVFNSKGQPTSFQWYVSYSGGSHTYSISPKYTATPQAYQSVYVGYDSNDAVANFVSGSGYFTYYGQNLQGTTSCSGQTWQTGEDSNLEYSSTFNCPSANVCSQRYNGLGLDGVANSGFELNSVSSASVTLSTSYQNDIMMVYTTLYPGSVSGISDSAGLTWHQRYQNGEINEWYAFASNLLSSDKVTVSFSKPSIEYQIVAFGVFGASSFDPNSGLPAVASGSSTSPSVSFSTSGGYDLVMAFMKANHIADAVAYPSGYSQITTVTTGAWEYLSYRVYIASQSNTAVTWSQSPSDAWVAMDDALSGP